MSPTKTHTIGAQLPMSVVIGLVEQYLLEDIIAGDLEGIRLQHRRGAKLSSCKTSFSRDNAFHVAITHDDAEALALLLSLFGEEAETLLRTAANSLGYFPIHTACRVGALSCLKVLLEVDSTLCCIPAANEAQSEPLHVVAEHCRQPYGADFASLLLSHGAYAQARDKDGFTPTHIAARYDNSCVLRIVLEATLVAYKQEKELCVKHGRRYQCSCIGRGIRDEFVSPLLCAVQGNSLGSALLLLEYGYCVHERTATGKTILEEARLSKDVHLAEKMLVYQEQRLQSNLAA